MGIHNDVDNFSYTIEDKRVVRTILDLICDLNNDGKINDADRKIRDDSQTVGATSEQARKATEYVILNDTLTNGNNKYDRDHIGPGIPMPLNGSEDDDAQEFEVKISNTDGSLWFEHDLIDHISFYSKKSCYSFEKMKFPFVLSAANKFPSKIYLRVDSKVNPSVVSDLILKLGNKDQSETYKTSKIALRIVNELGDTDYFTSVRDVILERNTELFVHDMRFPNGPSMPTADPRKYRICMLREESTEMRAIETYHASSVPADPSRGEAGIAAVATEQNNYTLVTNGNQVFFSSGMSAEQALLLSLAGDPEMTNKCHGRLVSANSVSAASSDNANPATTPAAGSYLAGSDPIPGTTNPGGKYIAQFGDGSFAMGAGMVPSGGAVPKAAIGGLSTFYTSNQRNSFPNQLVGYAPMKNEGNGVIFTITGLANGNVPEMYNRCKNSGVPALAGSSRATDIQLLILDSGWTSVALSHKGGDGKMDNIIVGTKHEGVPYYVNTYLGFKSQPARNE